MRRRHRRPPAGAPANNEKKEKDEMEKEENKRDPTEFYVCACIREQWGGGYYKEPRNTAIKTSQVKKRSECEAGTSELDALSAMAAAAVRKREKWKWLLPSTSSAQTTTSGTLKETFRAGDIRLSPYLASSARPPRWNSRSFTCLLAIAFLIQCVSALPPVIRIGGIFREDQKDGSAELAFKYAVYRLNRERTILPNTTLVYDIQYVPRDDSFRTSKKGTISP
ncbi:Glutamate receptor-like protein [Daphnia magna]|uniref:Glutamate receptor-like protein n=1 Tax=Daphnia magna TaxID=35525 RepID=A0A164KFQ2_9CRUS|nr:Glutamate receptor-like protein [Daphnia magna]